MQADASAGLSPPSLDARVTYLTREFNKLGDGVGATFDNVSMEIRCLKESAMNTAAALETLAVQIAALTAGQRNVPASGTSGPSKDVDKADPARSRSSPRRGRERGRSRSTSGDRDQWRWERSWSRDRAYRSRSPTRRRRSKSPPQQHFLSPIEPKFPCPKMFSGDFSLCRGFLGQCELFFRHQPTRYAAEETRVALVVSLLAGRALKWAMAAVTSNQRLSSHYDEFLREFRLVFEHPEDGRDSASRLHELRQGTRSVADYTVEFRILAADSSWDELALQSAYRRGLSDAIKDTIIQKKPPSLNALILLALQVDDRVQERRRERARSSAAHRSTTSKNSRVVYKRSSVEEPRSSSSSSRQPASDDEDMQLAGGKNKRLTATERDRRMRSHQCLYCGANDHYIRTCSLRPKDGAHL